MVGYIMVRTFTQVPKRGYTRIYFPFTINRDKITFGRFIVRTNHYRNCFRSKATHLHLLTIQYIGINLLKITVILPKFHFRDRKETLTAV